MELGTLVMTRGVADKVGEDLNFRLYVKEALERYKRGDWGAVDSEDRATNDLAAREGGRVIASYETPTLPRIWIITEADRSVTTVLFPEEY